MSLNTVILTLILFICFSCSESYQQNQNFGIESSNSYDLKLHDDITLPLDSLTPYYSKCIQQFENDSIKYLLTFNEMTSVINIYSLNGGTLSKNIDLKKGNLNHPSDFDGVFYVNADSILITSSQKNRIAIIDHSGNVIKEFVISSDETNDFYSTPMVSTVTPLVKNGSRILINGFLGPKSDPFVNVPESQHQNLVLNLDIQTGKQGASLSYPKNYIGKFWGPNMMLFYPAYNNITGNLVYSFAANHNLVVVSADSTYEVAAGSSRFNGIESMREKEIFGQRRQEYFLRNSNYGPVMFDRFNNVYYRLAYSCITKEDLESSNPDSHEIKQASIIILDNNFKYLGEVTLPRFTFTETMFFITKEGLYLGNWEKSKFDESKLIFSSFKLVKNEISI